MGASPRATSIPWTRIGVDGRRQVEIVTGMDLGHDDAELSSHVSAQRLHPVEQVAPPLGLHEVDQLEPEFQDQLFHGDAGSDRLGGVRRGDRRRLFCSQPPASPASLGSRVPKKKTPPPTRRNGSFGRPGMMASPAMINSGRPDDLPVAGQLGQDVVAGSSSEAARVTRMPADSERNRAGIWETSRRRSTAG